MAKMGQIAIGDPTAKERQSWNQCATDQQSLLHSEEVKDENESEGLKGFKQVGPANRLGAFAPPPFNSVSITLARTSTPVIWPRGV